MKKAVHIEEAKKIGEDSFDLLSYNQLPKNASIVQQVEALKDDAKWQEDHNQEVQERIDRLVFNIQEGRK